MTRTELDIWGRRLVLFLPLATAAGFRLLWFVAERMPAVLPSLPAPWWSTAFFLAVPGWCLLTLVCSARTGWSVAADGGLRGLRGFVFVLLITPFICGMHAIVCIVLFGIFPPFI